MQQIQFFILNIYSKLSITQLSLYLLASFVLILIGKIISYSIPAIFSVVSGIYVLKLFIEYLLKKYTTLDLQ